MEKEITVAEKVDAIMGAFLSGGMSAETMAFAIDKLYEAARMQKNDSQQSVEEPVVSESTPPELTVLEQMGQRFQSSAQAQIQNNKSFMRTQQPAPQTQQTGAPAQPQQPAPQTQQTVAPSQPQPVFQTQSPDPLDTQRIAEARTFGPHAGEPIQPQQPAPQPQQPAPQQTGAPVQPQQPAAQTQQAGTQSEPITGPQANAQALTGMNLATTRVDALKLLQPGELIKKRKVNVTEARKLKLKHNSARVIKSLVYFVVTIIGTYALSLIDKSGFTPFLVFATGTSSLFFLQGLATSKKNNKWNFLHKFQDWMKDAKSEKGIKLYAQEKKEIDAEINSRIQAR